MPDPTYEAPKDEHGHDMLSDEERVGHGFAPLKDDTDPRGREEREAAARGEEVPAALRASRSGLTEASESDEPPYSDAIEAEAYTRLRAGLPMTPAQLENRERGEREREARAQEAAASQPAEPPPSEPHPEAPPSEEKPPEAAPSPPAQPAPVTQGQPAGAPRQPRSGPPPPTPPPHPPAP